MKTEIRYSWIYNVIFGGIDINKGLPLPEFKKLKRDCKPFEKLYKKNINKIIKLIEKQTKRKKWEYNFIPIYIIKVKPRLDKYKWWKAFGDPLTIKFRKSPEEMLYILIHELVHLNLDMEMQIKLGQEKREELVILITKKVWEELGFKILKKWKWQTQKKK